jgi:hypothetical protein
MCVLFDKKLSPDELEYGESDMCWNFWSMHYCFCLMQCWPFTENVCPVKLTILGGCCIRSFKLLHQAISLPRMDREFSSCFYFIRLFRTLFWDLISIHVCCREKNSGSQGLYNGAVSADLGGGCKYLFSSWVPLLFVYHVSQFCGGACAVLALYKWFITWFDIAEKLFVTSEVQGMDLG